MPNKLIMYEIHYKFLGDDSESKDRPNLSNVNPLVESCEETTTAAVE